MLEASGVVAAGLPPASLGAVDAVERRAGPAPVPGVVEHCGEEGDEVFEEWGRGTDPSRWPGRRQDVHSWVLHLHDGRVPAGRDDLLSGGDDSTGSDGVDPVASVRNRLRLMASEQPTALGLFVATLVAVGEPDRLPWVAVALGPPRTAIGVPCWPGVDIPAELSASAGGLPELAVLADRVDRAIDEGRLAAEHARSLLAEAEAACLAEGWEASRLSALMEAAGDDRGAEVRRGVGSAHAAAIARTALRRLLESANL